jgi:hypothetical protein
MTCHRPASSVSSRRRRILSLRPPSAPLALLDPTKRVEREAHEFLTVASTGRAPILRLLDVRRAGPLLVCAVVWVRSKEAAIVEIDLADSDVLCLRFHRCFTVPMAKAEIDRRCAAMPRAEARL